MAWTWTWYWVEITESDFEKEVFTKTVRRGKFFLTFKKISRVGIGIVQQKKKHFTDFSWNY